VSSLFSNAMYIPIAWLAVGACLVVQRRVHGVDDGQSAERVDLEKDRRDIDDLHPARRALSGEKL
jgi:hypothetical protein